MILKIVDESSGQAFRDRAENQANRQHPVFQAFGSRSFDSHSSGHNTETPLITGELSISSIAYHDDEVYHIPYAKHKVNSFTRTSWGTALRKNVNMEGGKTEPSSSAFSSKFNPSQSTASMTEDSGTAAPPKSGEPDSRSPIPTQAVTSSDGVMQRQIETGMKEEESKITQLRSEISVHPLRDKSNSAKPPVSHCDQSPSNPPWLSQMKRPLRKQGNGEPHTENNKKSNADQEKKQLEVDSVQFLLRKKEEKTQPGISPTMSKAVDATHVDVEKIEFHISPQELPVLPAQQVAETQKEKSSSFALPSGATASACPRENPKEDKALLSPTRTVVTKRLSSISASTDPVADKVMGNRRQPLKTVASTDQGENQARAWFKGEADPCSPPTLEQQQKPSPIVLSSNAGGSDRTPSEAANAGGKALSDTPSNNLNSDRKKLESTDSSRLSSATTRSKSSGQSNVIASANQSVATEIAANYCTRSKRTSSTDAAAKVTESRRVQSPCRRRSDTSGAQICRTKDAPSQNEIGRAGDLTGTRKRRPRSISPQKRVISPVRMGRLTPLESSASTIPRPQTSREMGRKSPERRGRLPRDEETILVCDDAIVELPSKTAAKKGKPKMSLIDKLEEIVKQNKRKAAIKMQAFVRGRQARMEAEIIRLQARLSVLQDATVSDINQIGYDMESKKMAFAESARAACDLVEKQQAKKLKSKQSTARKLQEENVSLMQVFKTLLDEREECHAAQSRWERSTATSELYFVQLQKKHQQLLLDHEKLAIAHKKYQAKIELVTQELLVRSMYGQVENRMKLKYETTLRNILSRTEKHGDPALIDEVHGYFSFACNHDKG